MFHICTLRVLAEREREKDMSTKKALVVKKDAENRIVENISAEKVAELQKTAQDRILDFCTDFKKAIETDSRFTIKTTTQKNNLKIYTDSKVSAELCRKESYCTLYLIACKDTEERNKALELFKDTKAIHTCKTEKYLQSKELRIELVFETNTVDSKFLDDLYKAMNNAKKARADARAEKQA